MEGRTLRDVCRELDQPITTVRKWVIYDHNGFGEQYARARASQFDSWADEIIEDCHNVEDVQRARLVVDTKKWLLSKLHHKRYGDKVTQEHTGADGSPLTISWIIQSPALPAPQQVHELSD